MTDYLDRARQYAVVVVPDEDDLFVARAPDFPGAVGAARTRDEAAEELANGIAAMLEHAEAGGLPVPEPMRGYTGAFSIRLPRTLHMALVQRAAAEGLSVNGTITFLLTQAMELEGVVARPRRRRRPGANRVGADV